MNNQMLISYIGNNDSNENGLIETQISLFSNLSEQEKENINTLKEDIKNNNQNIFQINGMISNIENDLSIKKQELEKEQEGFNLLPQPQINNQDEIDLELERIEQEMIKNGELEAQDSNDQLDKDVQELFNENEDEQLLNYWNKQIELNQINEAIERLNSILENSKNQLNTLLQNNINLNQEIQKICDQKEKLDTWIKLDLKEGINNKSQEQINGIQQQESIGFFKKITNFVQSYWSGSNNQQN